MSGPQTPSLAITSLLVRTASGNAGVRGIAMALGLLLALAISRNTEVAVFGQYFWLLAVIELTGRVSGLGFNASLTRYLVTYRRAGDWPLATGVLRFALAVVPVTGALAGIVVVAVVGFWEGLPQHALSSTAVAALITLFVLYPLMQILLGALQGLKKPVLGNAGQGIVRPLVILAVLVLLIAGGGDLELTPLLLVTAAGAGIAALAMWLWVRRALPDEARSSNADYRPRLWLRTSLPMLFGALTWLLLQRIDTVMLAMLSDFHDTGLYVAATRIANFVSVGLILVGGIVAPLIAEFYADRRMQDLQRVSALAAAGALSLGIVAAFIILIAGEELLALFGQAYRESLAALLILTAGHLVLAAFGAVRALATMTEYEDQRALIGIATVLLNVLLNWLLIPRYGIEGAAAATSVSLLFSCVTLYVLARRKLGIDSTPLGLLRRGLDGDRK